MESLVDQEIAAANLLLSRHVHAASRARFFLGNSIVLVVVIPAIIMFLQVIGSHPANEAAATNGVLVIGGVAYGVWWHVCAKRAFAELRSSCLKLQRAGFVLHMKYEFLHHVLVAKLSTDVRDVEPLDFEHMTPSRLRGTMECRAGTPASAGKRLIANKMRL